MNLWRHAISVLAVGLATGGLTGCFVEQHGSKYDPGDDTADDQEPPFFRRDAGVDSGTFFGGGDIRFVDGSVPLPTRFANVVTQNDPPPAISGGSLVVTADTKYAVAGDPDRDLLYVVALGDQSVRMVRFAHGSEPGRVVLDGAGGVHVALRGSGRVVRVDLDTATVVQETTACEHPRGLAFDATNAAVLVACANGELVTLAALDHSEQARVFVALDLRDVVVGASGQRFVSRYRSAELLQLDAHGQIQQSAAPTTSSTLRQNAFEFDDAGSGVPSVQADLLLKGFQSVQMSPTLAWRTVIAPDGNPVMLHQQSQADEVVITQGGYGGGCSPIVQPCITRFGTDGKPVREPARLGGGALIVDVSLSLDGRWYALAKPGALPGSQHGSVELLPSDIYTDSQAELQNFLPFVPDAGLVGFPAEVDAGPALPIAKPIPLDGGPFPQSESSCNVGGEAAYDRQITAVAFGVDGLLYAFSREPASLSIFGVQDYGYGAALEERGVIALSATSVQDTGHDLFHTDVGSGLACASCHGEALDDGHIWNFRDFGPRRTQNIRGGILQTLPLHWEGDLTTFQHLADEVMTRRMSGFQLSPALTDALSQWIDKQPALRIGNADVDAVARGKVLFESGDLSCTSCHGGDALTDNLTVDVGTGGSFQVPSLRGLGLRAPYMHNGCADTLAKRFDPSCGGGDKHGHTSQLSGADINDLVAYLQTL